MSSPTRPVKGTEPTVSAQSNIAMEWGSDVLAELLRRMGIPYIALNPGSSYRGLHDSLVNYLGNRNPEMLVALHEEHAVAIAHGFSKVTGQAMAVAVHSNVGLMHATMAIYNAWCDRAPVLILGATGPVAADLRRPWIEWIHTSRDQGALVRHYTKWDEQPASVAASVEALVRAYMLTRTAPTGPTYVCFDLSVLEAPLEAPAALPDLSRAEPRPTPPPGADVVDSAVSLFSQARRPLILLGRASADPADWEARVQLAERLGARVITDIRCAAGFPTRHPLHAACAGLGLDAATRNVIKAADVILALDHVDLAGTLKQANGAEGSDAKVIAASLDDYLVNGWSYDHQALAYVDLFALTTADQMIQALLARLPADDTRPEGWGDALSVTDTPALEGAVDLRKLATCVNRLRKQYAISLARVPLGWPTDTCEFEGPLDYMGKDGGGGVGSGPGIAVGVALALKDTDRTPVAIIGDGDLLMGGNALWTAVRYEIPLLVIVANNGGYFNDVKHQEAVAIKRGRPVENKWVGQDLSQAPVDMPGLARSLGLASAACVTRAQDLESAVSEGLAAVGRGKSYLLEVAISGGYQSATSAGA